MALCTATLNITGTFTVEADITLDSTAGCQPAGSWLVNATVASMGTCSAVPVKASYTYVVAGTGRATTTTYSGAASNEDFSGVVQATGGGNCEGSFDHIVPDGTKFDEINLQPELAKATDGATTLTITGLGTYNQWAAHP